MIKTAFLLFTFFFFLFISWQKDYKELYYKGFDLPIKGIKERVKTNEEKFLPED